MSPAEHPAPTLPHEQKRTVLDAEDVMEMVPRLRGHRKLIDRLLHILQIDRVNEVHDRFFDTPGVPFTQSLLKDFRITTRIDGLDVLDKLPEGAFITVSNHPFGALDGITLISIIGQRRPEYKVMVNMILNRITAMRPNFIAVDQSASDDPAKKAVSMAGIREVMKQVRSGHPVGFFPAGAISKINRHGWLEDQEWKPVVMRLIAQLKVPVIPVFFHGTNSFMFNLLGRVSWVLRTMRLPSEVWRKCDTEMHVSIGDIITPEEIALHAGSEKELGQWLKAKTFELRTSRK
ncbi:MAG: 1-acyl-sn-glycerol-3-phosphate acyltransferase [Muribaculaceae bacterium]|jgi:putative hemolysin|nr:1-acyl-sn-glycerol-3-phosphate acyltransferase [Muribaculaceae bacterium]